VYDAIVVGARCAGSPTAMLLARKGYRVLIVDRDAFPSDIMSTHYIHQSGIARLNRWGLLDKVVATNCPPIANITAEFGPVVISGTPPPIDGIVDAYCPRRRLLDQILVEAAVEAGAEFREKFTVHDLLTDGDTVTGIRGRSGGGASVEERAEIVIGADGMHSVVARTVSAPEYEVVPGKTFGYYSYFSGLPVEGATVYHRERSINFTFPTNDGLTCVAVEAPVDGFHAFRANIEANFLRALDDVAGLSERVRAAKREEPFRGTGDLANFFRKPFGPGWALVGDAGYHKDPVTGQGITDALRDAELLSDAIEAGRGGRAPLDEALAGYEAQRNVVAMPLYQITLQQISFAPPPAESQMLLGAVARRPEEMSRFLGLLSGGTSTSEYFSPENLKRVIAGAAPAR
jgi:2-polyprenyl-6-methoxyphenol hydroxylase-like FAD-dependent oxidoreductase